MDALTRQCGGVPGLGTDFPAIAVRLTQHDAASQGKSIATIFVDAKSAFDAVIPKLVMPMDQSDEDIARLFRDLHLPPEALHELAEALPLTDAMTEAGASPTLTNDVLSTVTASHFTVRGSNKVGEATQGTRPGHPYADAVFAFAFQRDLNSRPDIPHAPQHTFHQQPPDGSTKLPILALFDDFTIIIISDSPDQFLPKVKEALKAVAAGLTTHGMQVNDSPGKTEIISSYHGPGSCAADQALHSQTLPVVEVCSPLFATLRVQVVDKYKHLGSYNTGHNRYELESNVRTAKAWSDSVHSRRKSSKKKVSTSHRYYRLGTPFAPPDCFFTVPLGATCQASLCRTCQAATTPLMDNY